MFINFFRRKKKSTLEHKSDQRSNRYGEQVAFYPNCKVHKPWVKTRCDSVGILKIPTLFEHDLKIAFSAPLNRTH